MVARDYPQFPKPRAYENLFIEQKVQLFTMLDTIRDQHIDAFVFSASTRKTVELRV